MNYRYIFLWLNVLSTRDEIKRFLDHIEIGIDNDLVRVEENEWPLVKKTLSSRFDVLGIPHGLS